METIKIDHTVLGPLVGSEEGGIDLEQGVD